MGIFLQVTCRKMPIKQKYVSKGYTSITRELSLHGIQFSTMFEIGIFAALKDAHLPEYTVMV